MQDTIKLEDWLELTEYQNQVLTDWVNENFKDHDKEVAFMVICGIGNLFPDLRPRLGLKVEIFRG